ncbi:MAG TPA: PAS domain-containing protein [Flavisolibacter sp.]|nr:PAS domain-containing protein [Flavisolibacter sp.]
MNETLYNESLFTESFGWQPQAFIWLSPVWDTTGQTIVDFIYMYSNEVGLHYLQLNREQLKHIRISNTPSLTDGMRQRIMAEMVKVFLTGETLITNIYNPIIDKYGKVSRIKFRNGILTSIQDTTEEAKAIQQLQEKTRELELQKELSNSILDVSMNGILAMEAVRNEEGDIIDFTFTKINQKCASFLGLPVASIVGKRYLDLLPLSKQNGLLELKISVIETGQPIQKEIWFDRAGKEGWYNVSIVKLGTNGIVQTFASITEIKQDKEQLEKAAQRFETVVNSSQAGMFTLLPIKDEKEV